MSDHGKCKISRHLICFVCGKLTSLKNSRPCEKFKDIYTSVYGITIEDNLFENWYIPSRVCGRCRCLLYSYKENVSEIPLKTPVKWRKPKSAATCYFCQSEQPIGRNTLTLATVDSVTPAVFRQQLIPGRPQNLRKRLCEIIENINPRGF